MKTYKKKLTKVVDKILCDSCGEDCTITEPAVEHELEAERGGSVGEPLAWGVLPGDGLPLWRCSSQRQAERVVLWLREQRPESTPEAVPLVDGRLSRPLLTDAEREAITTAMNYMTAMGCRNTTAQRTLTALLERTK